MTSPADLLFAAVPGNSLTFDPTYNAAGASEANAKSTAAKGACGKCTLCACKRAKG